MKNKLSKAVVYFMALAMFFWNTGVMSVSFQGALSAKAQGNDDEITICHYPPGNEANAETITINPNAWSAHEAHGDTLGECAPAEETIPAFSQWCSALYGIVESHMGTSAMTSVPDLDNTGQTDNSDLATLSDWYEAAADETCYQQFDNDGYEFSCENYWQIDWCAGLKQGIVDSLGSQNGDYDYSAMFDLNGDGYIDASDVSYVAMYLGSDDREACFSHYPFQLDCQESYCGNGEVEEGEDCDYNSEPEACVTEDGYDGWKTCNMPPTETLMTLIDEEVSYCTWDNCYSEDYCGDETVNGTEQCDDGNDQNGDGCSTACTIEQEEHPYAPWCSALYGILEEELDDEALGNSVPDIDDNSDADETDWEYLIKMYVNGANDECYSQFNNEGYQFNCENYLEINWCNGLKQGVIDSFGSSEGEDNYWYVYDLNYDGYIDASDLSYAASLLGAGDQQVCFDRFPFELDCQSEEPYCGNEIVEEGEECDWSEPEACVTEDGYDGWKTCNMPYDESINGDTSYCTWNNCYSEDYCGDETVNGTEQCDDGEEGSESCTSDCRFTDDGDGGGGGGPTTTSNGGGGGGGNPELGASNIQSGPQCNSTDLTFVTSQSSVSWVVYGTTPGNYTEEYKDTFPKTGHSITLPNLQPGTTYYYVIKMQAGNGVINSSEKTFTTNTDCAPEPQVLGTQIGEGEICSLDWRNEGSEWWDKDVLGQTEFADGTLIRGCSPDIYHIENGKGRHIKTWEELWRLFFGQRIYNIQDWVLELYL